jgi:hypothetical protein
VFNKYKCSEVKVEVETVINPPKKEKIKRLKL